VKRVKTRSSSFRFSESSAVSLCLSPPAPSAQPLHALHPCLFLAALSVAVVLSPPSSYLCVITRALVAPSPLEVALRTDAVRSFV